MRLQLSWDLMRNSLEHCQGKFCCAQEKDEEVYRLKMQMIDLKAELRKCCNSCMEAQSRCVELEEENKAKNTERDKLLQICDQLLTEAERNRKAAASAS